LIDPPRHAPASGLVVVFGGCSEKQVAKPRSPVYHSTMIGQEEIRQLPFPEKLALLEALWIELSSQPEKIEIPQWHKDILDERMQADDSGQVEWIDWEVAKQQIKEAIQ